MLTRAGVPTRLAPVLVLVAGVAAFATNQAVGVTLPVHIIGLPGGSARDVGLVSAVGTVGVIIGRLASGPLVRRFGPTGLGLISMATLALVCLAYLLASTGTFALAVVRGLHGVGFAVATTCLFVAMITVGEAWGAQRSVAVANMAMPAALVVAPLVAIELLDASLASVAVSSALIAAVGGVAYVLCGRQVPRQPDRSVEGLDPIAVISSPPRRWFDWRPSTRGVPGGAILLAALLGAADAAALDFLPVLATERGIGGFGWAFTVFAAATVAALVALTRCRRPLSTASLVVAGGVSVGASLALWPAAGSLPFLMLVVACFGAGFAVTQTGVNTAAAESTVLEQGAALAFILLIFDLGRVVGVYVLGFLIDAHGFVVALVPLALATTAAALMVYPRLRLRGRPS